jgi:DNA-binding transcriptional MerR regulator
MTTSAPAGLLVAELAAAAGVGPDTIRYYERSGLIEPPPRTSGGYRRFPPETVDRLRFIQGCQRLGLRLRDIGELLSIRDSGTCPCEPAETLLRRRVAEVDAELARLAALRTDLGRSLDGLPTAPCPEPVPGTWCPPDETEGGDPLCAATT